MNLPIVEPLPRYGQVVMLSDFFVPLPEIEQTVMGFAAHGLRGQLMQVLDPAEERLPFRGRVRFSGFEGEGDTLLSRVEALRQAYHGRLEEHRAGLRIDRAACRLGVHDPSDRQLARVRLVAALYDRLPRLSERNSLLELGPLAFASPWILTALALLPLLWWLLRVTPPAPQTNSLSGHPPAVRTGKPRSGHRKARRFGSFFSGSLAVAALIFALAHPLMNPSGLLPGKGPLLLVVDDGWAAASRWPARQEAMRQAVTQAAREERGVILLTTAPAEGDRAPTVSGVLKPSDARGRIDALKPKPWATDLPAATKALAEMKPNGNSPVIWLSDSLRAGDRRLRHGAATVRPRAGAAATAMPRCPMS